MEYKHNEEWNRKPAYMAVGQWIIGILGALAFAVFSMVVLPSVVVLFLSALAGLL